MNDEELRQRVPRLAGLALKNKGFVSSLDVMMALGWLSEEDHQAWRRGQVPYLERVVKTNLAKITTAMRAFHAWAQQSQLTPSPTVYQHKSHHLRFSKSGDEGIEQRYRTHYLKRGAVADTPRPSAGTFELTIHLANGKNPCSECSQPLLPGSFILVEDRKPVCLDCGDLDHLVFLEAGDAAMTRRSQKYSKLAAVVVKWSHARKRYERQGILVEEAAVKRARIECAMDADERAARREKDAERREREDEQLVQRMAEAIRQRMPGCPREEVLRIAQHTAVRGSGRVGRSEAGRALDEQALKLAVYAHIRHAHTNYDELLMQGVPRAEARESVQGRVDDVMQRWRTGRAENG
ncbi:MAG: DUF2293 domain-containing protein [Myxococcota bacterium]